jgi:hypothetical protein
MDPWLEHPNRWPDVHNSVIAALRFRLGPILRPRYFVRIEERIYLQEPEELVFVGRPGLTLEKGRGAESGGPAAELAAFAVAVEVPVPDELRETYLQVHEVGTGEVVTVLELLSPSNKREGKGQRLYVRKRTRVLETQTNLVEIDLVRSGTPMPLVGAFPPSDYRILVSRGDRRPRAGLWPFSLRDRLPRFHLPLKRGDDEPEVDLGAVLAEVYDSASYDLSIDYSKDPIPPLSEADRLWARELLCLPR